MAGGGWKITNRANAGSASSASQAAPNAPLVNRLTVLSASIVGTANGTDQLVVRDGASGTGTIIAQWDLGIVANAGEALALAGLDLRASAGNAITIEFVNGVANCREAVSASGDLVPVGYPQGAP